MKIGAGILQRDFGPFFVLLFLLVSEQYKNKGQ